MKPGPRRSRENSRPTVSAALIVRDEEAFLDGCLSSLNGHVDQVVIVDTGSLDASPAIARRHGVEPIHHKWTGDFSTARNKALDSATGDWILYIDADERLDVPARAALTSSLHERAAAACVQFMPRKGFTRYREPRLFLNRPDVRFRGRIHETVMCDINRLCDQHEFSILNTGIKLDHLGYDGAQHHKYTRNLPLLEAEMITQPDRVYYYYHLAETYAALGRTGEAVQVAGMGLEIARSHDREKNRADASLIYQLLGRLSPSGQAALELLEEGLSHYPCDHALRFQLAQQLADLSCHAEALSHLEVLRAVDPDLLVDGLLAFDRRIFGTFAWHLTARCWLATGKKAEAMSAFRVAAEHYSSGDQADTA